MSLHEIDADLKTAEATLSHWAKEYPSLAKAAMHARITYDLAWATAIERIASTAISNGEKPPTVAVQDALATQTVAKEMTAARLAETDLDVAKKLIGIAETTLTSIQTRAGLIKTEASLSAYQ